MEYNNIAVRGAGGAVPTGRGIYYIVKRWDESPWPLLRVIYVGQADWFPPRHGSCVGGHEKWAAAKRYGASYVVFVTHDAEADLDKIERLEIERFTPPLNDRLNPLTAEEAHQRWLEKSAPLLTTHPSRPEGLGSAFLPKVVPPVGAKLEARTIPVPDLRPKVGGLGGFGGFDIPPARPDNGSASFAGLVDIPPAKPNSEGGSFAGLFDIPPARQDSGGASFTGLIDARPASGDFASWLDQSHKK